MDFTKASLDKFKKIYREDYGITLTDAEACAFATSLINLMQIIARPIPDADCKDETDMLQ